MIVCAQLQRETSTVRTAGVSNSIWKPANMHQNVDGCGARSQPDGLLLLFSVSNTYSFHMLRRKHTFHVHHQKRKKIKSEHFQTGRWAFLSISLDFDGTAHTLPVTYLFLRGTWGAVCFIVRCHSLWWQITCWTQHWWQPDLSLTVTSVIDSLLGFTCPHMDCCDPGCSVGTLEQVTPQGL